MDLIKEAFKNIKEDILSLRNEINEIKQQIINIQIKPIQNTQNNTQQTNIQTVPTQNTQNNPKSTHQPTHIQTVPTQNNPIQTPYTHNYTISTGNEGVPTNTPTHQHTNIQTKNSDFRQVSDIIESLDNIKREIRLKFKQLTPQEMLVFSTLYTLEEQNYEEITYRILAIQINLSESSIRDYINKLIKKGIPIEKIRQNNKTIILNISKDLKNTTTLATIQDLRAI